MPGDDASRLSAALDQLAEALSAVGEEGWAARVRAGRSPAEVVQLIGRPRDGGLNDLVIHPVHGHNVSEDDDLDEINQRVGVLIATCYRLAARLLRDG